MANRAGRIVLPVGGAKVDEVQAGCKTVRLNTLAGDCFEFDLGDRLATEIAWDLLGLKKGGGA